MTILGRSVGRVQSSFDLLTFGKVGELKSSKAWRVMYTFLPSLYVIR